MTREEKYDLLNGTVWKKLLIFFLPIALGTVIQQFYNAADGLIVGRFIGTKALAAVGGSAFQITNLIVTFFVSFSGGAAVIIAQLFGAGRYKEVKKAAGNLLMVSIVIGAAVSVIGFIFTPAILELLRTPADTLREAIVYLRIYFCGVAFILILNIESGMLRAVGDSRSPFIYMIICCVTNIILDFVMVVPLGWGVAGAAVATVIAQVLNVILLTVRLLRAGEDSWLDREDLKFRSDYLGSMMRIGLPAGGQSVVYAVSNIVIQVGVNSLGTVFVASWAMSGKVDGIFWALTSAMGMAITTFVGQNYGAGRVDRLKACVKQGLIMALIITVSTSIFLLLIGRPMLIALTEDQAVRDTTYEIMLYFVPFYFIWTFIEVFGGVLRGAGDAVVPVIITCLGIGVFRIVWMILLFPLKPGLMILAANYIISWVITALCLFIHFRKGKWMTLSGM